MGIREWANKNQKQAAGVAAGAVLLAVILVVYQILASRQRYPVGLPDAYFTVDDGKSYFVANTSNYPPFDYKGQPAVRAYVFADKKGDKFVGYLERYTPEAKKITDSGKLLTPYQARFDREIKRPGEATWIKAGDMKTENKVQDVRGPDGSVDLVLVEPDL